LNEDNIITRIYGIFINTNLTFKNINNRPTRFSIIFPGIILYYSLIFYFLLFIPTIWRNIFFIQLSGIPSLELIGIFFVIMVIFASFSILGILIINFFRQIITNKGKKKKLMVLNYYFYSLSPFLLLLTQLPFIFIFNGHYQLHYLTYFYVTILCFTICAHITYLGKGIQLALKLNWQKTLIFIIIYAGFVVSILFFMFYLVYFSNISYSWLGSLF